LRGAVRGSTWSQAHSRTAEPCGGAGRILKRSSARGRAPSSTRGNQRPCRGSSRTLACQNACSCCLGMWPTSMHPRKKRCRCRSSPRTRPSETSQESAISGCSSPRAQGARRRPGPQVKSPAFLDRRTVEDTVEQPHWSPRPDRRALSRPSLHEESGRAALRNGRWSPGLAIDLREGPQFNPEGRGPLALGQDADRPRPLAAPEQERGPMHKQFVLHRSERTALSSWPGSVSWLDGTRLATLLVFLLALSATSASPAGAQPPAPRVESAGDGSLEGLVTTADGRAVAGARVGLVGLAEPG